MSTNVNHPKKPVTGYASVLYSALANCTGKLRVSDAFLICGIEAGSGSQGQFVRLGRAIRELGWERRRRRFDGVLEYAYVKGTDEEREVELEILYDPHMRRVRVEPRTNEGTRGKEEETHV